MHVLHEDQMLLGMSLCSSLLGLLHFPTSAFGGSVSVEQKPSAVTVAHIESICTWQVQQEAQWAEAMCELHETLLSQKKGTATQTVSSYHELYFLCCFCLFM